ncbi:hypothetical protein ABBQ32_010614 [Trebouxia sp. C0010 RCD-2024]
MGLNADKSAAGEASPAEGTGVPEVIGVRPGAVEDRSGKLGNMPGAGAIEDGPGAGAGIGLSMKEGKLGVASPAGGMGAGVKIAPLVILPGVWLAERVRVLITAGETRVGVEVPQAGEIGVDWRPEGAEAAARGGVE